jgi:pimeloyl-ACP methyl ester carboxylesterase
MPTVHAGDLDVHYTERGSGPPMVLVHGGLATAEIMWNEEYVSDLAKTFRVLMPDSRGHGKTTNPAGTLSYPQMADDVVAFCAALGIVKPVVVGYSDGAQVGIELGRSHAGCARAIVLGGVVTAPTPAYFAMLAKMGITKAGEVDIETMRREFGDALFAMMVEKAHASWRAFVNQISTLWMTLPAYSPDTLAKIATPCLVICGDRDQPSLDAAVPLSRALSRAELAVIPNSAHGAAGKPLFWTAVRDFLTRH